jgi:hypothetical protein
MGLGSWFANHWKTIAVIGASIVVGVGLTVLTGGLLGVPALVALGGGVLGGGGLAAAAASAVGAFGAGVTSYLLGNALEHRASTWKGALVQGALSTALTFGTLGLGKGIGLAAPFVSRWLAPFTRPVGEAIAPIVRPLADAVANTAKPVTQAVTRTLENVNGLGQTARQTVLKVAGRGSALDAEAAAQAAREASVSQAQALRNGVSNRRELDDLPRSVTGVTDASTGVTTVGVTAGDLNAKMAQVFAEQGYDLAAMQRNLDVEGLRRAMQNPAIRAALDPRIADAIAKLPASTLLGVEGPSGQAFLALPWNCSEIQALRQSLAAGTAPGNAVTFTSLTRTNDVSQAGTAFKSCPRCTAIQQQLSVTNASDAELANATHTSDTTVPGSPTQTTHETPGAAHSEGFTNALEKANKD